MNLQRTGIPVLISDKIDFGIRILSGIKRDRIKESIHQDDIIILNVYVPKIELQNMWKTGRTEEK